MFKKSFLIFFIFIFITFIVYAYENFLDDFNDNSLAAVWTLREIDGATTAETNQQLECTGAGANDLTGIVTTATYKLNNADIYIETSTNNAQQRALIIALTKVTATDYYFENNWYRIAKRKSDSKYWVEGKENGGSVTAYASGAWNAATGTLGIGIKGGVISFYEDGILRYSRTYDLGSPIDYNAYIYIEQESSGTYNGIDIFDNFSLLFGRKRVL